MLLRMLLAAMAATLLPVQSPPLFVSAATSLSDVLEEIATAYTVAGGATVQYNFGGSNALARQIVNGAPADVFISADDAQMDVVDRAGLIVRESRVDVVSNQLVVAAPNARVDFVRARFAEAPPEIRRLAIGDPAAVPAGVYARQYLEARRLWKVYAPRIVPTANVRAALVALENGAADAAIVYATDVAMARGSAVAIAIPLDQGPRIVYPAALLSSSSKAAEAKRFLAFVVGPQAAEIFRRHRFLPASRK